MKVLGILFSFMLLMLAAVVGSGWWIWQELHTPVYHSQASQPLEVAGGERLDQVLTDLQQRGIIKHSLAVRLYLKANKMSPIVKAGNYYFPSPISPLQTLEQLEKGGEFNRLTIIEGWTRWDIANAMCRIPTLGVKRPEDALKLLDDPSLVRDIDPQAGNLEGYLFPDTYFLVSSTGAKDVVKESVKRFRDVWANQLSAEAAKRNISIHEAVTVASIIETEAKLKDERPLIASVVENRVKRNMPLSMDSTIVYASKLAGAWKNDGKVYQSDIDRNSPYNTRKNLGLPPGPVGSPGLSSLKAAVQPAQTDYLYYVRNPDRNDGAHNFYSDEKQFEVGVQALRAWEQKHH